MNLSRKKSEALVESTLFGNIKEMMPKTSFSASSFSSKELEKVEQCENSIIKHVQQLHQYYLELSVKLNTYRISGNAAYIIGSICKFDVGKSRIVDVLLDGQHKVVEEVLSVLNNILASKQEESVMNALGTIATIVSSLN